MKVPPETAKNITSSNGCDSWMLKPMTIPIGAQSANIKIIRKIVSMEYPVLAKAPPREIAAAVL